MMNNNCLNPFKRNEIPHEIIERLIISIPEQFQRYEEKGGKYNSYTQYYHE